MSVIDIERSIVKKYRKDIWRLFVKGVNEYHLIDENDNILVCISGGKDSFLLAKCLEELKRHGKYHFNLKFMVMNPGYKEEILDLIKENAKKLGVDITIYDSDIFAVSSKLNSERPCYMCARMRRGFLYNKAKELGCNKIALGHHFDDVIETTLMSLFYNGEFKTMMPRLSSMNFEGIDLIRPLYLVREESVKSWARYNDLKFINCACSFTEKGEVGKRSEVKAFIKRYTELNPSLASNIFKALEKVNLETIISYKEGEEVKSVLDKYE